MTDDLADLRKIDLPFDIDEVDPVCHDCVRNQLKKYQKFIKDGKSLENKFIVPCTGIPKTFMTDEEKAAYTDDQILYIESSRDVAKFAQEFVKLPEGDWLPRDYQINVLRCTSRRRVLRIGRRTGKCISGNSKIMTENGPVKAKKLHQMADKPKIVTFDETTGDIRTTFNYKIWSNGQKETVKIKTKFGKETTVTKNHPFLVMKDDGELGWTEAQNLTTDDKLAAPVSYENISFNEHFIKDTEARLLGYLIGDGGLTSRSSTKFTNINPDVLEDMKEIVDLYNCELNKEDDQTYRIVSKNKDVHVKYRNNINNLTRKYNIRKLSTAKRVPVEIMRANISAVVNFLGAYWDTDGWYSVDNRKYNKNLFKTEIGLGSSSEKIIDDVMFLLARLGIFSNKYSKKVKYKNELRNHWHVSITDKQSIILFGQKIKPIGKINALNKVLRENLKKSDDSKSCKNLIPKQISNYVKKHWKLQKKNLQQWKIQNQISKHFSLRKASRYDMTKRKLKIFAEFLEDDYLMWLATNNIMWDEIVEISQDVIQETFDLNVPETSTLVADGIISHNTASVCVDILYKAFTSKKRRILVTGPQKNHVEEIFNRLRDLMSGHPFLRDSIVRDRKAPYYEITLKNGSRIRGIPGGAKGKKEGLGIRGQDADDIYVEEMDYVDENSLRGGVFPILHTTPHTTLTGFSTPSGFKTPYFYLCTDNPLYKEFHFTYKVLPHYKNVEAEKGSFTEEEWQREYLAEFGDSESGVYKPSYIDRASKKYEYDTEKYNPSWRYTMGADWNEKYGAEIVVLGYNPFIQRYKVVDAYHVERSEFTQLNSVQKVLEMNKKWKPKFVFVDAGNGATNYELLMKTAYKNAGRQGDLQTAKLLETLKKYDAGAAVIVKDPITHKEIKKPAKPFMVNSSIRLFEQDKIDISSYDEKLEKQLRNYIIDRINPSGTTVYGMDSERIGDHRLDAFNLACVAAHLNFDELHERDVCTDVVAIVDPRLLRRKDDGGPGAKDIEKISTPQERRLPENELKTIDGENLFARIPGRVHNGTGKTKTDRLGWDTDQEELEMRRFIQRKRQRGNFGRSRPKRNNF